MHNINGKSKQHTMLINKVFIGQAEIRVGQEMPVVVTNSGKNQLILIQKNYLSKWKILGRVWKSKLQSKCCSTNDLPVQFRCRIWITNNSIPKLFKYWLINKCM